MSFLPSLGSSFHSCSYLNHVISSISWIFFSFLFIPQSCHFFHLLDLLFIPVHTSIMSFLPSLGSSFHSCSYLNHVISSISWIFFSFLFIPQSCHFFHLLDLLFIPVHTSIMSFLPSLGSSFHSCSYLNHVISSISWIFFSFLFIPQSCHFFHLLDLLFIPVHTSIMSFLPSLGSSFHSCS